MKDITTGRMRHYYERRATEYDDACVGEGAYCGYAYPTFHSRLRAQYAPLTCTKTTTCGMFGTTYTQHVVNNRRLTVDKARIGRPTAPVSSAQRAQQVYLRRERRHRTLPR
jgi:hypothetical protein